MDFINEPTRVVSSTKNASNPTHHPSTQDRVVPPSNLVNHHLLAPQTPPLPPSTLSSFPLRYPETLGILITVHRTNSPTKGLGLFALVDIPPGTILLSESPLVTLTDTGSRLDPLDLAVSSLSPSHEAAFLSLHGYSSSKHESRNRSIVYSNGYSIIDDFSTGVFETASRINHSCVPNSEYVWKEGVGRLVFWNRFELLEGEEITVDYGHKKHWLKKIYGFECTCGGCTDSGSDTKSSSGLENVRTEEMGVGSIDEVVGQSTSA